MQTGSLYLKQLPRAPTHEVQVARWVLVVAENLNICERHIVAIGNWVIPSITSVLLDVGGMLEAILKIPLTA